MTSTHQLSVHSIPVTTRQHNRFDTYQGFLTSNYKRQIHSNTENSGRSLFGLKQRVKSNQQQFTSTVGTVLKVSVFVIAYLIAFV